MRLTYIYHSGFAIEADDFTIIMDYYEDSIDLEHGVVHNRLLYRPQKLYVLVSHGHPDHFNSEVLKWREIRSDITYIFSKDLQTHSEVKYKDIFFLDKDDVFEDDLIRVGAYGSTDLGISFKISFGDFTMFHAGDLNNWHWNEESTKEEIKEAEEFYLRELNHIAESTLKLDVAIFPVDPRLGIDFTLGAEQFLKKIPTQLFVPMHFGTSYEKAMELEDFAKSCGAKLYVPPRRGDILDNLEDMLR